ncbi:uncharacterized protein LOC126843246 [Adelges cooleyi]|uniref:uncharacterized protein LOC126843246 n=1 Tax=Adelges cooleyi TaxID=133065 RepID=UPI00217FEB22|nr:uncharacterized protein LOC126843246 [Adelges cooleyi]
MNTKTSNNICLTNVVDNEIFTYPIILLKGCIQNANNDKSQFLIKHISVNNNYCDTSLWTIYNNRFKVIIELKIGNNKIIFKYGEDLLQIDVIFKPRTTKYTVSPVYVICADHDGKFQAPNNYDNSVEIACKKILLGSKLIQMLTAEKMDEKGFGKKTFYMETECQIIKSSLTRQMVFNMNPEKLWQHIARELTANQNSKNRKFLAFLSCTYWDGENLHGHVALGGGGLALFGTGCLYTWPSQLKEVLQCFTNMKKVDTNVLLDDSCFRGNFGGCFSTTLGSVWHEIGHTFDLGHTKYGIMGRGFDNVHLTFTLDNINMAQESISNRKRYIVCIENCINNYKAKEDLSNNNSVNNKTNLYAKSDECDTTTNCWSNGCAAILLFHKWFNSYDEEKSNGPHYVVKRNLLTSTKGLKVVQLRRDDGFVTHSWEFLRNNNKQTFILPVQLATIGTTIVAEDSNGNILKHSI